MFELVENRLFAYADNSTLLAVFCKTADRLAVAASLNMDLACIWEWCNHWCMILNPNKTKALVVSRSRTVSPPLGDLVLSGVSIWASPNLNILGMKFDSKLTFEDHVCGIVSGVSQSIGILRLVKCIFVDTSVLLLCSFTFVLPILEYFAPVWGSAVNVTFSFLCARCIQWPGFILIRVSCHCVMDIMWLGLVCCTGLIQTLIAVCSASFHLLLLVFNMPELWLQLIHWSLTYQFVECSNLLGLS